MASALGVAVLVTIMREVAGARHGYDAGWVTGAVLAAAAGVASLAMRRPAAGAGMEKPAAPGASAPAAAGAEASQPAG